MPHENAPASFGPTSGTVTGWIGVVIGVATMALLLVGEHSVGGVRGAAMVLALTVVVWAFMLRPRILLGHHELVLRNALADWHVPLASVEELVVRQTTVVVAHDRRLVGIAVGKPLRQLVRADGKEARMPDPLTGGQPMADVPTAHVADFMTGQVLAAAERARAEGQSAGEPFRSLAIPELVVIGASLLAFVVLLLV